MNIQNRFATFPRRSLSLCNVSCQNILYKSALEHFLQIPSLGALLLTSKSFQNSSFGANLLMNFRVDELTIPLLGSVLAPSSCLSIQFVTSLYIHNAVLADSTEKDIADFVGELVRTKYLALQLRTLSLVYVTDFVVNSFFATEIAFPQLHSLELCCIPEHLDNRTINLVAKSAANLTSLSCQETLIADAGLEHISKLSAISTLNLNYCHQITDVGLQHVSALSNLVFLDLSHCMAVTDLGLDHISECSSLATLKLVRADLITDVGLRHISKLSEITSLDFDRCSRITDVGLAHISVLNKITFLDLSQCCRITDGGLQHICKLSEMESLDLSDCKKITDDGLECIAKSLGRLRNITLTSCGISDASLKHLSVLPNLTSLMLVNCTRLTDAGLEYVAALKNLRTLSLTFCFAISTQAKKKLTTALPNCHVTGQA